jgi:DNA polymerase-1
VLGHYIGGQFAQVFIDNPYADVHQQIADWLGISRKFAKTIGFGLLYGLGLPALAQSLGVSLPKATELYDQYLGLMPELKVVKAQLKDRYNANLPIVTFGGRSIKADPPSFSKKYGRVMTYHYKLLNYLVQGGSADVTKQAIVNAEELVMSRYNEADVLFNITVHDELNFSVAEPLVKEVMPLIAEAMHSVKLDCPLTSEGEVGTSWGTIKAYD